MAVDLTQVKKETFDIDKVLNLVNVFFGLIILMALWLFVTQPLINKTNQLKLKIKSAIHINNGKTESMRKEKEKLSVQKKELEDKMNYFKEHLEKEKDISAILDRLTAVAKKCKLNIKSITPLRTNEIVLSQSDEKKGEKIKSLRKKLSVKVKEIPISLELTASFSDFLRFFWETERTDPYLTLKELIFEADTQTLQHKERLTFNVYELIKSEKDKK